MKSFYIIILVRITTSDVHKFIEQWSSIFLRTENAVSEEEYSHHAQTQQDI